MSAPTEARRLIVVVRATADQEPERPAPERVLAQRRSAREALTEAARLAGCPDTAFEKSGPRGKPLPTAGGWHWSISHDATLVAAVVSHSAPVGVDLERIVLRRRLLVERVADPKERELLTSAPGSAELDALGFARLWTGKEAVLKAERIGLPGLVRCKVTAVPSPRHLEVEYEGRARTVLHTRTGEHLVSACLLPAGGDGPALPRVAWHLPLR